MPSQGEMRSGLPSTIEVMGIGWIVHDRALYIPRFPEEDTKIEASEEIDLLGGPVMRALTVVAAYGRKAAIGAIIGDDLSGRYCREAIADRAISTDCIQVDRTGRTRRAQVWINSGNGSRTIAYSRGTLPALTISPQMSRNLDTARLLHLDGREAAVASPFAKRMHEQGKLVTLDAGGWKADLELVLSYTDVLIVPASTLRSRSCRDPAWEARRLGEQFGLRCIVMTEGNRGVHVLEEASWRLVPAFPVDAVDTHGAGDLFAGALIYGLLEGWSTLESVRFAAAVAALGCARPGDYVPRIDDALTLTRGTA